MQLNRNVQSQYFSPNLIKAVYGIAIIMMMLHHLYDDPSLIVYTIIPNNPFIEEKISFLGKMCVGIYSFLAGTGAARVNEVELNRVVSLMLRRIKNLYKKYWFIFVLFVPVGYFIDIYQFNGIELLTNFCALSSTYNGTWWYIMVVYISIYYDAAIFSGPVNSFR